MAMTMGVARAHEGCKREAGGDVSGRDGNGWPEQSYLWFCGIGQVR